MYTVRVWDISTTVDHVVTRDYYDIFDAIISASIDLGARVLDPAEWYRTEWQDVAEGVKIHYRDGLAVSIIDRSLADLSE